MGGPENVAEILGDFHANLRDWFCADVEFHLARLIEQRDNPQSLWKEQKPTIEQLMAAQLNVQRLEEAIEGMETLSEKDNHIFAGATAMMRPMIEMQLDSARQQLTWIQSKMEQSDEAAQSPMSNVEPAGEGASPDEAKP
jgi:hypothetical protein